MFGGERRGARREGTPHWLFRSLGRVELQGHEGEVELVGIYDTDNPLRGEPRLAGFGCEIALASVGEPGPTVFTRPLYGAYQFGMSAAYEAWLKGPRVDTYTDKEG